MKLQRLLSLIRQAVDQYEMIEEGDHIAIGISGGKVSLTLLWGLAHLQKFYPKHFSLSEEDGCIRDETGRMYRAQSKNVYKPEQKERQGGIAADDFPW